MIIPDAEPISGKLSVNKLNPRETASWTNTNVSLYALTKRRSYGKKNITGTGITSLPVIL